MDNYIGQQITSRIDFSHQLSNGKKVLSVLTAGLFAIIFVTILQDLVHSRLNNYSFYLSESLLFKAFWFLFLPLLFIQFKYLNKVETKTVFRPPIAILTPTLIHLLLTPLVIFTVSAVFYSHTYSYYQTLIYTISEDIYKMLMIYGSSFFLHKFVFAGRISVAGEFDESSGKSSDTITTKVKDKAEEQPVTPAIIVVSSGRKYVPISVSDILYVSAATPYVAIHLKNKRFLHNETLKSINEKLNAARFVRIHKSTIVNLHKIISYKSRLNGDYDVLLENGDEIRLSRNYSAEFKKHFDGCPQVER